MALLQLSEPGQSPDPHSRRVAVGIDLGTTHSLVAALRHGHAESLFELAEQVDDLRLNRNVQCRRRLIGHQ